VAAHGGRAPEEHLADVAVDADLAARGWVPTDPGLRSRSAWFVVAVPPTSVMP
jgi:hypothetical protein